MIAKIINVKVPGIQYFRGEIPIGRLFEVITNKGSYMLSRPEILSLLEKVGKTNVERITASAVALLKDSLIDISKISDK